MCFVPGIVRMPDFYEFFAGGGMGFDRALTGI
ncbi:hypothetical protein V1281_004219 [Nitrobacteraceae bacterium AZCC 2161]